MTLIVVGCRRGDREAQRQFYQRHRDLVFRLAVRMTGAQEAPDVVQDVFLQAFRTIHRFAGRSSVETWLYRVAVNECLQFHRRRKKELARVRAVCEPPGTTPSPARRVEHCELLDRALESLEPELRCVFVLREVEGLSYGQIAQALGLAEGTVASRLSRARTLLKERLLELGWEF